MREKLTELLAKVEQATGPDRRLDYEVFVAFAEPNAANPWDPKEGHRYTSSVDAAIGLAEQRLPGWAWGVSTEPPFHGRTYHAFVAKQSPEVGRHDATIQSADYQPGAALALLTAMLRALLAQTETSDAR